VSSNSVQTNNHNANANANPAQPQPVVKRRMQMFGSEYAKFLSNTAFGPRLVTPESSTRSTHNRPTMQKNTHGKGGSSYRLERGGTGSVSLLHSSLTKQPLLPSLIGSQSLKAKALFAKKNRGAAEVAIGFFGAVFPSRVGTPPTGGFNNPSSPSIRLEDQTEVVLGGAIMDVCITHNNDPPLRGFYRVSYTSGILAAATAATTSGCI